LEVSMNLGPLGKIRVLAVLLLVAAAALAPSCGKNDSPAANTPPATPSPTAPPATQPVVLTTCQRIGMGPGPGTNCPRESPTFLKQVDDALNTVVRQHPEIFNLNDERGAGGYRVLSRGRFYVYLIDTLNAAGLCADFDSAELQVKTSNDFNDQYAVMVSSDHIRRGDSSYRSTCYPAAFPTPIAGYPDNNGCPLPHSLEKACSREKPVYLNDVEGAIDELYKEHPEFFDFSRHLPGTDWPKLVNQDAYERLMIEKMQKKGYCARHDEELAIKKDNTFNEQYDIIQGDGFVRRGEGSYRSSCYPAAF
jgi:hypothetical protein